MENNDTKHIFEYIPNPVSNPVFNPVSNSKSIPVVSNPVSESIINNPVSVTDAANIAVGIDTTESTQETQETKEKQDQTNTDVNVDRAAQVEQSNQSEVSPHAPDVKIRKIQVPQDDHLDEYKPIPHHDTLVLSGGATKGFLLLGALQYACDNYYLKHIKTYVGTSIGAIICYLLVIGYTPIEIMVYICTRNVLESLQKFNIQNMMDGIGAASFSPIHDFLEKMTINKIGKIPTLKYLKDRFGKTLVCATYNITQNKVEYLSPDTQPDLPALIALRMSSNLPLIFEHFKYDGSYYIDGGISDNFPIHHAEQYGERVLGIMHSKKEGGSWDIAKSKTSLLNYVHSLLFVPISQTSEFRISLCKKNNTLIRLQYNKPDGKIFDFNISVPLRMDMFSFGYQHTKTYFESCHD